MTSEEISEEAPHKNAFCTKYCEDYTDQIVEEIANDSDDLLVEQMPNDAELFTPGVDTEDARRTRLETPADERDEQ